MSSIDRFAGWLSCPQCDRDLDASGTGTVACSSGHRFDIGSRGYIGLLREGSRITASRSRGARPAMKMSALPADAVAAMAPRAKRSMTVGHDDLPVTDPAGCVLSDDPAALASIDDESAGVLADLDRRWPVRDAAADTVLALSANPFPAEIHRVLAGGGLLITIADDDDVPALIDDLYPWFEHDQSRPLPDTGRTALRLRRRRRPLT